VGYPELLRVLGEEAAREASDLLAASASEEDRRGAIAFASEVRDFLLVEGRADVLARLAAAVGQPGFVDPKAVRALLDRSGNARASVEIDGGVDAGNAARLVAAGVDILVAGAAIFAQPDPEQATRRLRAAALGTPVG